METTYRLNTKELSIELIRSIQEAFGDKDIEITVTAQRDDTEFLLSTEANRKQLYESMDELAKGKGVAMSVAELQAKYLR